MPWWFRSEVQSAWVSSQNLIQSCISYRSMIPQSSGEGRCKQTHDKILAKNVRWIGPLKIKAITDTATKGCQIPTGWRQISRGKSIGKGSVFYFAYFNGLGDEIDLKSGLVSPIKVITSRQPSLFLLSMNVKIIIVVELTVAWAGQIPYFPSDKVTKISGLCW